MSRQTVSVLSDLECELGEGPSYDPITGTLYWFDIVGRKLIARDFGNGDTAVHELPFMASAIAAIDDAAQLIAAEDGLYRRDRQTGQLVLLKSLEDDDSVTRSNDGRVHPSGALWVGTMGRNAERHAGAIYWFRRGELRLLYPDITIANSICFSPDGSTAYFADTAKGILFRVDCDPKNGLPVGEPDVFVDHRGKHGGLDGSVVDADGVLWNARWGAAALDAYSPSGKRIETIEIPALQPTCPAFAGPDASRLIVTSAWQGMNKEQRTAHPQSGMTFLLTRKVAGRFEPRVLI